MNLRILVSLCLFLVLAPACLSSCAASEQGGAGAQPTPDKRPELTDEKIAETIIGERVEDVPDEANAARPIDWVFYRNEPKNLTVIEKQVDGDKAIVVVDVQTASAPKTRYPRRLAGRLRLRYELQNDFIFRRWNVVEIENISMKYRDEPRSEEQGESENRSEQPAG